VRISTKYQYENFQSVIRQAQSRVFDAQREVTTGKKNDLFGTAPADGATVLRLNAVKSQTQQYNVNIRAAKDYLSNTDQQMERMHDLLKKAYTLTVQSANSTVDQNARSTMANEIGLLQKQLLEVGNSRGASGQYLFAGQMSDIRPFTVTAGTPTYAGDFNAVNVETGPADSLTVNSIGGPQMVSDAYTHLETLKNNMISGNIALLSGQDINNLQTSMDAVRLERGGIGAKLQFVQDQNTQNTRRIDELTDGISSLEEVDISEAITRYQLAQTSYQAALQTTASIQKLSLMDFIR